jgi:hypothetical protein
MPGQQVKNGKAFEYALANQYFEKLVALGVNVTLVEGIELFVVK